MKDCIRCGNCCQDVMLAESPGLLQQAYIYWKKTKSIDPNFSEIYLIYPMLTFKFETPEEDLPYHYSCKHFFSDSSGTPACSIHPVRPRMCKDFPYYESEENLDRTGPLSPYNGCGYNNPD